MAKNFIQFDKANEYVLNKDVVINHYIKYMLARTQSIFTYEGLPDTIPAAKLEMMLQTKGYVFITEIDGKLYALHGSLSGLPDVYEDYTEINVANTALNISRTFNLENDGVLVNNDALRIGLLPIFNKYGALLAENTITIHTVDIILRMVCMISASDDRTQSGAEKFIKDIEQGKISAIGESAFFEGIRVHSVANTQNYLTQFIDMEQYLKASCFNEIGLNANYNMKKTALNSSEVDMNDDFLLPLVDNMIKERQSAIEKINEKYGTDISIDFASAWKVTHEENEKQIAISESIAEHMEEGEPEITLESHKGLQNTEKPLIKLEGGELDDRQTEPDSTESRADDEGTVESSGTGQEPESNPEHETEPERAEYQEHQEREETDRTDDEPSQTDHEQDSVKDGEEDDRNKS